MAQASVGGRMSDLKGLRVLVVEDSPVVAMSLCDMLEDLECVVAMTAPNMATALEAIENTEFDAAIVDLNIRGMKSYSLLRMLDQRKVPFLISSGYADWTMPEEWRDRPRLPKPFSASLLRLRLDELLHPGATDADGEPT